jgi:hypothetical protein
MSDPIVLTRGGFEKRASECPELMNDPEIRNFLSQPIPEDAPLKPLSPAMSKANDVETLICEATREIVAAINGLRQDIRQLLAVPAAMAHDATPEIIREANKTLTELRTAYDKACGYDKDADAGEISTAIAELSEQIGNLVGGKPLDKKEPEGDE